LQSAQYLSSNLKNGFQQSSKLSDVLISNE
jgi:hypothetical protein